MFAKLSAFALVGIEAAPVEVEVDAAAVGELALDGAVRPVKGALSIALAARDCGLRRLLVPPENARAAAVVREVEVFAVTSLAEAIGLVTDQFGIHPIAYRPKDVAAQLNRYDVDFAEVRGQEFAKRAMILAAAGSHNLQCCRQIILDPALVQSNGAIGPCPHPPIA